MQRGLRALAAIFGALAVGLGAYAAHGLEGTLRGWGLDESEIAKRLNYCDLATRYQLVHAVALLVIASGLRPAGDWIGHEKRRDGAVRKLAGLLIVAGIVLFSGSLVGIAFTGNSRLGMITPVGGLCLILGWLAVALDAVVARSPQPPW